EHDSFAGYFRGDGGEHGGLYEVCRDQRDGGDAGAGADQSDFRVNGDGRALPIYDDGDGNFEYERDVVGEQQRWRGRDGWIYLPESRGATAVHGGRIFRTLAGARGSDDQ